LLNDNISSCEKRKSLFEREFIYEIFAKTSINSLFINFSPGTFYHILKIISILFSWAKHKNLKFIINFIEVGYEKKNKNFIYIYLFYFDIDNRCLLFKV
jgi:hypothetical protein